MLWRRDWVLLMRMGQSKLVILRCNGQRRVTDAGDEVKTQQTEQMCFLWYGATLTNGDKANPFVTSRRCVWECTGRHCRGKLTASCKNNASNCSPFTFGDKFVCHLYSVQWRCWETAALGRRVGPPLFLLKAVGGRTRSFAWTLQECDHTEYEGNV